MQVAPSGGQICNKCKWCHLVAKFGTNASCAIWWPNLELMQVEPPLAGEITQVRDAIPGSVVALAMFFIFCHHWTVWPAFDSVDCGGHHAISCQTCWIENANGKGPTYDPALYRDFYVSWKLIITHL